MDGILVFWKERGMTSHDCVMQVRRLLRTKKVGHTGTLDPGVAGVLPLCIGSATKLVSLMTEYDKQYIGAITIGWSTTTEDSEGACIARQAVVAPPNEATVDAAMASFLGSSEQVPPMYSAVKVAGKRLYEYARAQQSVERPKRIIHLTVFERTSPIVYDAATASASWQFRVVCSKGTYVRTLAVDLGAALGYPAHMSALTRVASGGFSQQEALTFEQVERAVANGEQDFLRPIESVLHQFTQYPLSDDQWQKVRNGSVVPAAFFQTNEPLPLCLTYRGKAVALYDAHPDKPEMLKPLKMFGQPTE